MFVIVVLSILAAWETPAFAQQVKNVAVSRVEPGQAILVVKTDIASDITVDYGVASGVYTMVATSTGQQRHEVILTGLPPGARIFYRVTIADSANPASSQVYPEKSFSAFKPAGQPFRFVVAGDNRPDASSPILPTAAWMAIIPQMAGENPDLALHVGDIIHAQGTDTAAVNEEKYDAYFNVTSELTWTAPYYMAPGNHERLFDAVGMAGYKREFTLPENNGPDAATAGELYYSFDYGDTHFIILSTELPGQYGLVTGNQKLWLEGDLAANSKPWTIAVFHQPLYGQSGVASHAGDPWVNLLNATGQQNRADIISLFELNGVDLVFTGHDHYYRRHQENGIQYVVTAGGGAPLYNLPAPVPGDMFAARAFHHVKVDETGASLAVSVIDTTGTELESFTIGKPVLGLATTGIYWNSFADFTARELSVDYSLDNSGQGDALNVQLTHSVATNGVFPVAPLPFTVGDLDVGQSGSLTMKYLVPFGVSFFRTSSFAVCDGLDGIHYLFPGPPPGI